LATVHKIATGGHHYYMSGVTAALRNYLGHTITAMSSRLGSQLTLHIHLPAAAAAAQQAAKAAAAAAVATAEAAAAAAEAAAAWHVHQV
jgi:hypothetical protein